MTSEKTIRLRHFEHRGENCIHLDFPDDPELTEIAQSVNAQWSEEHQGWYVIHNQENLRKVVEAFEEKADVDTGHFSIEDEETESFDDERKNRMAPAALFYISEFRDYMRGERYKAPEVQQYSIILQHFFDHFSQRSPHSVQLMDIKTYFDDVVEDDQLVDSYKALRLFYQFLDDHDIDLEMLEQISKAASS